MFLIHLKQSGDILYASLEGNLNKRATYKIDEYLIPYVKKNAIKSLWCDCSKLKKMDLEGKYALLNTKITLKKQKGNFLICNMNKDLKEGLIGFHFKIMNNKIMEA